MTEVFNYVFYEKVATCIVKVYTMVCESWYVAYNKPCMMHLVKRVHNDNFVTLTGTFKCNITSQKMITNTIEVSCELLETLRKISVTVMCINCYSICSQPITVIGDSPVTVSDLVAGQYAVEMAIADATDINDTIVEIITVSGNDIPINSTTVQMITASNTCTSTMVVMHTGELSSKSTYVAAYVVVMIINIHSLTGMQRDSSYHNK